MNWKEYLWLAIPGLFLMCSEWWTLEIGTFITGTVDGTQLAAYNITLNLVSSGFLVCSYYKNCTILWSYAALCRFGGALYGMAVVGIKVAQLKCY